MIREILEASFTTKSKLEKIKYNLERAFAEALRYSSKMQEKYPTYEEQAAAMDKFVQDIAPIKDLDKLNKMYKDYSKMSRR